MFAAGWHEGRPRVTSSICPIRVIDASTEAVIAWFLLVADREPWAGSVVGVREWPRPGGVTKQPAVLVEAVQLLTAEFNAIVRARKPNDTKPKQESSGS